MALTQAQKTIVAKAQAVGAGQQGIALPPEACAYLVAVSARDLGLLKQFPEFRTAPEPFFGTLPLSRLSAPGVDFLLVFERLLSLAQDTDTYFSCLATLHKARLKYERILETQPIPTIDQLGPRGLLHYGSLSPKSIAGLLLWRKWVYDVDNRAAQETGYVFEPIIAAAIGGVPVSSGRSPVRRQADERKGRQVDCVLPDKKAYEIKIRVTIAASGQGRWREELEFPGDCKASLHTPILVVLDPTPNPKLDELRKRFIDCGGEVYVGDAAWQHFGLLAGPTMSRFLELYVHEPIESLLAEAPKSPAEISGFALSMSADELRMTVGAETLVVKRTVQSLAASDPDELPEDIDQQVAGP